MFVIVADNQTVFQKMLSQILSEQGVDFHICSTGAEVKEAMKVRSVDLFVLGMNLPDIDGASLCRYIRQQVKDDCIPIIILTSNDRSQSFADVFREGATDVFRRNRIEHFSDYLQNLTEFSQPLKGRVMVVEDSSSQRQLLQQTLSGWGLSVDTFPASRPAVEAHLRQPYDVVLTDIELNGLENGLDIVHDIRQQAAGVGDVPIIAITAYLSDSTRVNFLARGIDRCMQKPILMPELRSELKKQIDARRLKLEIEYERRAERSKNKAKTDFLARMSHELRTSLNAIIGFSNLLIMGDDKDSETRDYAGKINSAGKLLLELINEVLDLSHIESGNIKINLESVRLADILDKCQQVMQSFASEHQITLRFSSAIPDVKIRCDVTRLTEVILNLISNAIKYNRPGGHIDVSAQVTPTGFVRIHVVDDGIGIAPEFAEKIFEPFARGHAESHTAQGTGIGLTIALQLVELMGGKLDFSSELGTGSTFWIDIPQSVKEDAEIVAGESPAQQAVLMPCKVLYVDDNPVNCLLIEKWFGKQVKASVCIASSAREALQLLPQEQPQVVITDIHMPGESGYWLLQQIRADGAFRHLPVVALSAMAMEEEVEKGKLSGFSAYLTKPFDFQVLVKTLNLLSPASNQANHDSTASHNSAGH